ncbi:MAG TPA: Xaa-Pro peptidase family protein [Parachlamydiaceae bacterium]|nr:Xaa-Pro peptidase family protein [Parachlamydiaceae bacterium]
MTYHARLHSLQQTIQKNGCDAFLLEDPVNLFYMTGLELSTGRLLVHSKGADVLVDGRYFESCKKKSPFPVTLADPPAFEAILSSPEFGHIQKLGFDSETTTYKSYESLQKIVSRCTMEGHPLELMPLDAPLKLQRSIKDAGEIQALQEAAALGSRGFDFVSELLEEGITEKECALELEIFWKRLGSKGVAFDPIIAFGANSSMPHHRAGNDKLKVGQIVLIDIGVNFKHYHSDMTRIVFYGKPDTRLLAVHAIVQKAQQAALSLCKPGTLIGQLDKTARDIIAEHGYAENFTHSLGHGVGLDIHEYPTLRNALPLAETPLKAGMVITIEPGIYLPQIGGVRIEDTVAITEEGHENLTLRNSDPIFV